MQLSPLPLSPAEALPKAPNASNSAPCFAEEGLAADQGEAAPEERAAEGLATAAMVGGWVGPPSASARAAGLVGLGGAGWADWAGRGAGGGASLTAGAGDAAAGLVGEEAAAGGGASLAPAKAEAMAGLTRTSCSFLGPADLRAIRSCREGLEVCA